MLKDLALLIIGAIFGLGPALAAMAAPLYFPNTPRWIWHYAFWLGAALFFLMALDTGVLFLFYKSVRYGTLAYGTLGLILLVLAATHQFARNVSGSKEPEAPKIEPVAPQQSFNRGTLQPDTLPNPELINKAIRNIPISLPSTTAFVIYGTNISVSTFGWPNRRIILRVNGVNMIEADGSIGGALTISTLKIFDADFKVIARITNNEFWVRPDARFEHPTPSSLQVFNSKDEQVLYLHLVNRNVLVIEGKFYYENGPEIEITNDLLRLGRSVMYGDVSINTNSAITIGGDIVPKTPPSPPSARP